MIQVKRSAVPNKVPQVGDLAFGEFAVNTYDGKLYLKKDSGTPSIVEIGAGGGAITGVIVPNLVSVTTGISIAAGSNGSSVGPITINAGGSVTIESGQRWVVL